MDVRAALCLALAGCLVFPTVGRVQPGEFAAAQNASAAPVLLAASTAIATTRPSALRLSRRAVLDTQGFGYEAFSVLLPADWIFEGGVAWSFPGGMAYPQLHARAVSPDGSAAFEVLPSVDFMWATDPMMVYSFQQQGLAVMPPQPLESFLRQSYLPHVRPGATGLKVLSIRPDPEEAERTRVMSHYLVNQVFHSISPHQFPPQIGVEAALVEVEYAQGGHDWIETFAVVLSQQLTYVPGMMGAVAIQPWGLGATAFRVQRDRAEAVAEVVPVIMRSAQSNPRWLVDHTRLAATLTRQALRQQREIFDAMQRISATQVEIGDMITDAYQRRSAAMDRIHEGRVQAIRGVESYRDPLRDLPRVELPSGYDQAWTDGSEIILTNDPRFDPSAMGRGDWSRMERVPR
jgi:hypothetical protein